MHTLLAARSDTVVIGAGHNGPTAGAPPEQLLRDELGNRGLRRGRPLVRRAGGTA
jgi:hypothetical protein